MRTFVNLAILCLFVIIGCSIDNGSSYKILVKDTNEKSKYRIVIQDYNYYYWAILYKEEALSSVCSCFLWSSKKPLPESEMPAPFNGNPPISEKYASNEALFENFIDEELRIIWNKKGDTSVVLIKDNPICLLDGTNHKSFSKSVKEAGPYGLPWDDYVFNNIAVQNNLKIKYCL